MAPRVKLWFYSDPHFGHENIIRYCNRPFANAQEMDDFIIDRINSVVEPHHHLYCLGDVAMGRPALATNRRILCRHQRLLMGNHDIYNVEDYLKAGFEKVMAYRVIDGIIFSHIPIAAASFGRFRANVHGHIHNNQNAEYDFPYINLSVEVINYTPVSFEELEARIRPEALAFRYDPSHGEDKLCRCGHPYYRHFDTYDNMRAVGCKYCECDKYEEGR